MEVVMKKGFIAALSRSMCLLLLPVNAYVENDLLGEVKRPFDLQAATSCMSGSIWTLSRNRSIMTV